MPRTTIQRFRAVLADASDASTPMRAYRELARRPELAAGVRYADWPVWSQPGTSAAAH